MMPNWDAELASVETANSHSTRYLPAGFAGNEKTCGSSRGCRRCHRPEEAERAARAGARGRGVPIGRDFARRQLKSICTDAGLLIYRQWAQTPGVTDDFARQFDDWRKLWTISPESSYLPYRTPASPKPSRRSVPTGVAARIICVSAKRIPAGQGWQGSSSMARVLPLLRSAIPWW